MNKVKNTKDIKRVIQRSKVRELLLSAGYSFFTVEFIKKNNEVRILNGRLGVKKHLHGGKSTVSHKTNYITVYDVHAQNYRNVNVDTMLSVKVLGRTYQVI